MCKYCTSEVQILHHLYRKDTREEDYLLGGRAHASVHASLRRVGV